MWNSILNPYYIHNFFNNSVSVSFVYICAPISTYELFYLFANVHIHFNDKSEEMKQQLEIFDDIAGNDLISLLLFLLI